MAERLLPTAGRRLSALGGVALLGALALDWFELHPPGAQPTAVSAFELLERVDLLLALLALGAVAAAFVPHAAASLALRAGAGAAAAGLTARELVSQQGSAETIALAGGGWAALLASAAVVAGAAVDRHGNVPWPAVDRRMRALSPIVFLVPVAWTLGQALANLFGTSEPDLGGWANAVLADARAVHAGEPLYQDPANGYTGQLYTPLDTVLVGLLHHLRFWSGWAPFTSIAASLASALVVARVAYRADAGRLAGLVEALGLGALAWWLVSALQWSMIFTGHTDQVAWAFAIAGLVAAERALRVPGRGATALAVALLSAAFWTKQTTIVADVAVVLVGLLLVRRGRLAAGTLVRLVGALAAVNLAVLGVLNLLTGGWEFYFNFLMTLERPPRPQWVLDKPGFLAAVWAELRAGLLLPALFAAVAWGAVALERRRRPRDRLEPLGSEATLALLCLVFVALYLPFYVNARRPQGTFDNHAIGMVWALALAGAAGYRLAARRAAGWAPLLVVVGAWALTQSPELRAVAEPAVRVPPAHQVAEWPEVPEPLLAYARDHLVWHPSHSTLNARRRGLVYPNVNGYGDLLSMGRPSRYLERAILERRFDAVGPIPPYPPESENPYFSGNGRFEENYYAKLQAAIAAKYDAERPVAGGALWARRAGPDSAAWMNACFGPFELAGATWRINKGGGFWCAEPPGLRLRETIAPYSDVRTSDPVRASGRVAVDVRRGTAALLAVGAVSVHVEAPAGGDARAELRVDGGAVTSLPLPQRGERLRVELSLAGGAPALAAAGRGLRLAVPRAGVLRLGATQGSDARWDLAALRLVER